MSDLQKLRVRLEIRLRDAATQLASFEVLDPGLLRLIADYAATIAVLDGMMAEEAFRGMVERSLVMPQKSDAVAAE